MDFKNIVEYGDARFGRKDEFNYKPVRKKMSEELDGMAKELWDLVNARVEKDGKTVIDDPETASSRLTDKINFYMRDDEHVRLKFDCDYPKDIEIYTAAGFSKSKWQRIKGGSLLDIERGNAFAIAVALRLDETQTEDLLRSAGFCINYELELDCAIMYFIRKEIYDMKKINNVLKKFSNIKNGLDCFTFRPRLKSQKPI